MKLVVILVVILVHDGTCAKKTPPTARPHNVNLGEQIKKDLEGYQEHLLNVSRNMSKSTEFVVTNMGQPPIVKPPVGPKKTVKKMITPNQVQAWAQTIANKLHATEEYVVRRGVLLDGFVNVKPVVRNGSTIADKAAAAFTELLKSRAAAAEAIMRRAEKLQSKKKAPKRYTFNYSYKLNEIKVVPTNPLEKEWAYVKLLTCRNQNYVPLQHSSHFDADVSLDLSSVHVAAEVFDCHPKVLQDVYWSEALDDVFRENYRRDSSLGFQYFCSAKGFLRHYPAASWDSMFKLNLFSDPEEDPTDVYDCRLRPWYVSAGGAPRDILIMMDGSGSMHNSSNKVIAEQFTLALLNALTDDDQINIIRFNNTIMPAIPCFADMFISANHVNTAAYMAAMKYQTFYNETDMKLVIKHGVLMLQRHRNKPGRRAPCQQAIVLITDTWNDDLTELMTTLNKDGDIRLFVIWTHDPYGVRDGSRMYSDQLSCISDGYFAELVTDADVTEQVIRVLRVLERPLVMQRTQRLKVFSDVYAHIEDPRRSEYYWTLKEREEQKYRYIQLRRNKDKLLNSSQLYKDYMHQYSLDEFGQYYEGLDVNYRLQISVSVPVFENTTSENITITLNEERKRRATRTYPVNRLLGVAGVDIPIDHLKLLLPFYQVGGGGRLFIVDHRGNVILHENLKPTFNGDILKPGYRTVDLLDLEQAAEHHEARNYTSTWFDFRTRVIIDQPKGTETLNGKHIFEYGMRARIEPREYTWRRVLDHYTVMVTLPRRRRPHAVPTETKFTQKMAEEAMVALQDPDFVVHPDWLYCKYIHKEFNTPEEELKEFLRRRRDDANFPIKKLEHFFFANTDEPADLGKAYQCDEELMSRLCSDAIATAAWAKREEVPASSGVCVYCELGSLTAFISTESGLTRWQQYHATGARADPPDGALWPLGPKEPWYIRASGAPSTLVIHAPVAPIRRLRNTDAQPPPLGERVKWLTAARVLEKLDKGIVGVAGFHFYPQHLQDFLESVTNFPYADDDDTHVTCEGPDWSCLLVDDGGWVIAGEGTEEEDPAPDEPVRRHLATYHPAAMAALLRANVFELKWIHDYQAVCFPPAEEELDSAGPMMPSILRSVWLAVKTVLHVTSEAVVMAVVSSYGHLVSSETAKEKEKRRNSTKRSFDREKFDRLFDERVLVNRTRIAACDRSRPFYVFHRDVASEVFKRGIKEGDCKMPLVGAMVPRTNLILLAVYTPCLRGNVFPPDPMINQKVRMQPESAKKTMASAAVLACWRNIVPLPTREPQTTCYPHQYEQEEGYRQCGPWLPDAYQPDEDEEEEDDDDDEDSANGRELSRILLYTVILVWADQL